MLLSRSVLIVSSLGLWNGFTYDPNGCYPNWYMMSFYIHASMQEGQDFESSGFYQGIEFTLSGKCDQDCDGNVSVTFMIQYSKGLPNDYLLGHMLPDGSLTGTSGFEETSSNHVHRFILRRTPAEVMCHRPSPAQFLANKPRTLWKFALAAIHAQVLKEMWSWKHFAQRRDTRIRHIKLDFRRGHGSQLDEEELEQLAKGMRSMTSQDSNFYRLALDWQLRIVACH